MNNQKKKQLESARNVIKWVLAVLLAGSFYIYMTTGQHSIPLPLIYIPMTVAVASKTEPFTAGIWGFFCGMMTDSAFDKLFGFNAIIFAVAAVLISLMFMYILRQNIMNILLLNAVFIPIQAGLDFLFFYGIWNYPDEGRIWLHIFMPQMLMTLVWTIPVYLIIRWIFKRFGPIEETYIEEKSEDIVRE